MSPETSPVLVDTSAWIDSFRGRTKKLMIRVQELLRQDRVVTCGPVLFEIRQGLRPADHADHNRVLSLFEAIPCLPFEHADWEQAGSLAASLRQKGRTLPPIDVFIGHLCLRHKLSILTLDEHFYSIPGLRIFEP